MEAARGGVEAVVPLFACAATHTLMVMSAEADTTYASSLETSTDCTPARWPLAGSCLPPWPRSHISFQPVSWLRGCVSFS